MRTEIIYEDSHVLVVYKPGGLATQTARAGEQDVVGELKNYLHRSNKGKTASARAGEEPYVGVVHRVDQPVEGLLVFAKNRKAAASLTAQLQKTGGSGMLHKCYYAAAWGTPPAPEGELVDYLLKSRDNRAVVAEQQSGAKKAVLRYRILGTRSLEEVFSRELPGLHHCRPDSVVPEIGILRKGRDSGGNLSSHRAFPSDTGTDGSRRAAPSGGQKIRQ